MQAAQTDPARMASVAGFKGRRTELLWTLWECAPSSLPFRDDDSAILIKQEVSDVISKLHL